MLNFFSLSFLFARTLLVPVLSGLSFFMLVLRAFSRIFGVLWLKTKNKPRNTLGINEVLSDKIAFICVSYAESDYYRVFFGRTAEFWLPLVQRAQLPHARKFLICFYATTFILPIGTCKRNSTRTNEHNSVGKINSEYLAWIARG